MKMLFWNKKLSGCREKFAVTVKEIRHLPNYHQWEIGTSGTNKKRKKIDLATLLQKFFR